MCTPVPSPGRPQLKARWLVVQELQHLGAGLVRQAGTADQDHVVRQKLRQRRVVEIGRGADAGEGVGDQRRVGDQDIMAIAGVAIDVALRDGAAGPGLVTTSTVCAISLLSWMTLCSMRAMRSLPPAGPAPTTISIGRFGCHFAAEARRVMPEPSRPRENARVFRRVTKPHTERRNATSPLQIPPLDTIRIFSRHFPDRRLIRPFGRQFTNEFKYICKGRGNRAGQSLEHLALGSARLGVIHHCLQVLAQRDHRHHGAGAVLLAVPGLQPIPEFVVAGGPATRLAPLRQRLGPGECTGLVAQHIEVMLQIKHMLAAAVTTLVAGNPPTGVPDLHMQRMDARFHPCARRTGTE